MLDEDPILIVLGLLEDNWESSNTPLANDPTFTTGWYDMKTSSPQVTITNPEEGVMNAGITGQSGGTGSGGVAQYRMGQMLVNCWGGSYDDLSSAGTGGSSVSPKDASYQMAREVHRIMQENASGTSSNGSKQLHSLGAADYRRVVEDDVEPAIFRCEVTVMYSYSSKTS